MGEWEDFHDSLRVYRLLERATESIAPPVVPIATEKRGHMSNDVATLVGLLGRNLICAFRDTAAEFGITMHSLSVDVEYETPGALAGEPTALHPTVRYQIVVDANLTADELDHIHACVQSSYLQPALHSSPIHVEGSVRNVRAA